MQTLIKPRYPAFRVGPLPAKVINAALGTELDVADVWVSKACHSHIATDHPEDYPFVKANLIEILRTPMYAGQDPQHQDNFYLVKRVERGDNDIPILIAVGLTISRYGAYNVKGAYSISEGDILSRRLRGSLHNLLLR